MNKSEEQLQSLLQKVEERERTARRRAVSYTVIPIICVGILLWVTGSQVVSAQRELSIIQQKLEAARKEVKTLDAKFTETGSKLREIVEVAHEMEEFIEKKESFLRSLGEARFLIDIRMLFDKINVQFAELSKIMPEMPPLGRGRTWLTIVGSYKALDEAKRSAARWIQLYGRDQVAIYSAPNRYYALAIKGDGSFTAAYRLTVGIQKQSAPDAYFASSQNWGDNLIQ